MVLPVSWARSIPHAATRSSSDSRQTTAHRPGRAGAVPATCTVSRPRASVSATHVKPAPCGIPASAIAPHATELRAPRGSRVQALRFGKALASPQHLHLSSTATGAWVHRIGVPGAPNGTALDALSNSGLSSGTEEPLASAGEEGSADSALEEIIPGTLSPGNASGTPQEGGGPGGLEGAQSGSELLHEALGSQPGTSTSRRAVLMSAGATLASAAVAPPFQKASSGLSQAASLDARLVQVAAPEGATSVLASPALASLRDRVSTFRLPNGMQWVVLQRRAAPVVACHTYANVGASDEEEGCTGVAHLLEHLAFKGTPQVGTSDYLREAVVLDQLDEAFYELRYARDSLPADSPKIASLQEKFDALKASAGALAVANEYGSLLSREGGVGLNAVTSQDSTEYYVSLPSNKLELWMALESARFLSPVFRELYSEKEVVKEERRMRIDNSPYGRVSESFVAMAFPGQPYGRPTIGYPSDLERIGRREVEEFFAKHYTPRSLCCAVVGDVDPEQVERLALKYFGQWAAPEGSATPAPWGPAWRAEAGWKDLPSLASLGYASRVPVSNSPSQATSPAQEMRVGVAANPLYLEGYLRPNAASVDDPALSVLSLLLSGTRSSRFYKNLILPGKVLSVSADESFPGDKYQNLFLVSAFPAQGASTDQAAAAVQRELTKMAERGPTASELERVRKSMEVGILQSLTANSTMAGALCAFTVRGGSWTALLEEQEQMASVSKQDIREVSQRLFGQTPHFALHAKQG